MPDPTILILWNDCFLLILNIFLHRITKYYLKIYVFVKNVILNFQKSQWFFLKNVDLLSYKNYKLCVFYKLKIYYVWG